MARESMVYSKAQRADKEAMEAKADDAKPDIKPKRATRSSHGIVQAKRFGDVVDWTQHRSPGEDDKRMKREESEAVLEDEKVEEKDVKPEIFPRKRIQVVKKARGRSRKPKGEQEVTAVMKASAQQEESAQLQPTSEALTDGGKDEENVVTLGEDHAHSTESSQGTAIDTEGVEVTLHMLVEEHKKLESTLKSFGKLLKAYKEQQEGISADRKVARGMSWRQSAETPTEEKPDQPMLEVQDAHDNVRDEETAMIVDAAQGEKISGSESPPPLAELRRRTLRCPG